MTDGKSAGSNFKEASGIYLIEAQATIEEDTHYRGNRLEVISESGTESIAPCIGANCSSAEVSLHIKSGAIVAKSTGRAAAIGTDSMSTLNLTIDAPADVEAYTGGEEAAIGTPEGAAYPNVNITINGGRVAVENN